MKRAPILLGVLVFALVGCGEDESDDNEGENDAGQEMAWDSLDFEARQGYMAQTVMPAMREVFAGYDAAYADNFSCGTCHGSDLSAFAMPSDISPLSAEELGAFTFEGEGRQEIANVMAAEVLPRMAELLGQTPFDPATGMGTFACSSCHAIQ